MIVIVFKLFFNFNNGICKNLNINLCIFLYGVVLKVILIKKKIIIIIVFGINVVNDFDIVGGILFGIFNVYFFFIIVVNNFIEVIVVIIFINIFLEFI